MAADAAPKRDRMTREEYLALQRTVDEKLWLWDGEVFEPQAASIDHERIVANVVGLLRAQLLDGPCEPLPSAVRIRMPGKDRYVYPDAVIACAPLQLEDDRKDTLLNPSVVFEVLSPSTEAFDRGAKAQGFRTIPSLRAYVVIAQDRKHVEALTRAADGSWTLREARAGEDVALSVPSGELRLPVDEIYRRVELPPA